MNNEVMCFENDNGICEAVDCFEKAATKINVKVGKIGIISLDLCSNCVKKFDQREGMLESVSEPLSNTNQNIQPLPMRGELHQEND